MIIRININKFTEWVEEYNSRIPDVEALQKDIDQFMEDYDRRMKEKSDKEKDAVGQEDEEGWITVTKKYVPFSKNTHLKPYSHRQKFVPSCKVSSWNNFVEGLTNSVT